MYLCTNIKIITLIKLNIIGTRRSIKQGTIETYLFLNYSDITVLLTLIAPMAFVTFDDTNLALNDSA